MFAFVLVGEGGHGLLRKCYKHDYFYFSAHLQLYVSVCCCLLLYPLKRSFA